jgi:hypothetical protein
MESENGVGRRDVWKFFAAPSSQNCDPGDANVVPQPGVDFVQLGIFQPSENSFDECV